MRRRWKEEAAEFVQPSPTTAIDKLITMCAEGTFYYDYDESLEALAAAVAERDRLLESVRNGRDTDA